MRARPAATSWTPATVAKAQRWLLKSCVSPAKSGEPDLQYTSCKPLHRRVGNISTTSHGESDPCYINIEFEKREERAAEYQQLSLNRVNLVKGTVSTGNSELRHIHSHDNKSNGSTSAKQKGTHV